MAFLRWAILNFSDYGSFPCAPDRAEKYHTLGFGLCAASATFGPNDQDQKIKLSMQLLTYFFLNPRYLMWLAHNPDPIF